MQIEQQLLPSLLIFGEGAGSAGAESAEGALQIDLAHLLPKLLKAQVMAASHRPKSVPFGGHDASLGLDWTADILQSLAEARETGE